MILRCCITCWTSGWLQAQPKNWSLFLFHIPVRWSPMGPNSASGFHTGTRRGRWLLRLVRHLPGKRPLPTRRNKKDNWVVWLEKKASAFFVSWCFFQIPTRVWAKLKGLATQNTDRWISPSWLWHKVEGFWSRCPCYPGLHHRIEGIGMFTVSSWHPIFWSSLWCSLLNFPPRHCQFDGRPPWVPALRFWRSSL